MVVQPERSASAQAYPGRTVAYFAKGTEGNQMCHMSHVTYHDTFHVDSRANLVQTTPILGIDAPFCSSNAPTPPLFRGENKGLFLGVLGFTSQDFSNAP